MEIKKKYGGLKQKTKEALEEEKHQRVVRMKRELDREKIIEDLKLELNDIKKEMAEVKELMKTIENRVEK